MFGALYIPKCGDIMRYVFPFYSYPELPRSMYLSFVIQKSVELSSRSDVFFPATMNSLPLRLNEKITDEDVRGAYAASDYQSIEDRFPRQLSHVYDASNNTKYLERQKGEAMEGEVAAWTEPQNDGMNESSNANDVEPNSASGAVAFRGAVGD